MEPSPIIAPSILAADFAHLGDEVRAIEGAADWVHVDVMDNHFVPNLTIGLPVVQSLRKATVIPFDVHLMITDPERWAPAYAEAGAHNVTFTPVEPYLELLPYVDTLLIMTIKAGFGGQQFLPAMLEKVRAVRRRVSVKGLEVRVEVDGGIAADTIEQAAEAGADAFVAGTAVYGAADPAAAIRNLRALAARARVTA